MRLRLQLPRSGRRAGLGGLALALLAAGCGGGGAKPAPTSTTPAPVPRFAIGIDEKNPHLLAPGDQPAPFAEFRDALAALKPTYVRVLFDWSVWQPSADAPPDFGQRKDGCARGAPPCAEYAGVRATLEAVKQLGARPLLLIYGTPDWAARPPEGCERPGVRPYARAPRLAPYRGFVRSVLAVAREAGFDDPYLSPWNEPNTPIFLNPQRRDCRVNSQPLGAMRYSAMAAAAADLVRPGRLVLGETAGITPHTHAMGAAEFAISLPRSLVCRAAAWAQHAYVTAPRDGGARVEPVAPEHNAEVVHGVELAETGAGGRPGACSAMARQLRIWQRDPQIAAAFQYTLRDDPIFPVGLADAALTKLYPAYEAWRSRGARC